MRTAAARCDGAASSSEPAAQSSDEEHSDDEDEGWEGGQWGTLQLAAASLVDGAPGSGLRAGETAAGAADSRRPPAAEAVRDTQHADELRDWLLPRLRAVVRQRHRAMAPPEREGATAGEDAAGEDAVIEAVTIECATMMTGLLRAMGELRSCAEDNSKRARAPAPLPPLPRKPSAEAAGAVRDNEAVVAQRRAVLAERARQSV
jgi:hypothetical protein